MEGIVVHEPTDVSVRKPRPTTRQESSDRRWAQRKAEVSRHTSVDADHSNSSEQRPRDEDDEEDEEEKRPPNPVKSKRGGKPDVKSRRMSLQVPGDTGFSFHQEEGAADLLADGMKSPRHTKTKSPRSPKPGGILKSPTKKSHSTRSPRSSSNRSLGSMPRPKTASAGGKTLRRRPAHFSGDLPVGEDPDVTSVTATADFFGDRGGAGNSTAKLVSQRSANRTLLRNRSPSWCAELASLDSCLEKIDLEHLESASLGFVKGMDELMPEEVPPEEAIPAVMPDSPETLEEDDDPLGRPENIGLTSPPAESRVLQKMKTQSIRNQGTDAAVERLLGLQVAGDESSSKGKTKEETPVPAKEPEADQSELFGKARTLQSLKSQKGLAGAMLSEGVAQFFAESDKVKEQQQTSSSFSKARTLGLSKRPATSAGHRVGSRSLPPQAPNQGSQDASDTREGGVSRGKRTPPRERPPRGTPPRERPPAPTGLQRPVTAEPLHRSPPPHLEAVAEDETAVISGPPRASPAEDYVVTVEGGGVNSSRHLQGQEGLRSNRHQQPSDRDRDGDGDVDVSKRAPSDRKKNRTLRRNGDESKREKEAGHKTLSRHSKASSKKDNFAEQEFDTILDEFMKNPQGRKALSRPRRERRAGSSRAGSRRDKEGGTEDAVPEDGAEVVEDDYDDALYPHGHGHGLLRSGFSIPKFSIPSIPHVGGTPRQVSGVFNIFHKNQQPIPAEGDSSQVA